MADPVIEAVVPDLETQIQQTMADQRVVGLSIGIVRGQELAWSAGYGHADFEDARAPDARSLFRFDSNTKPMTAMAIMQLRDEGLLNIDDPLVEYIPEFAGTQQVAGRVEDVTLRRLMTHRSGLSGEVPGTWHATGVGPTIEEVLAHIGETGIVIPPDSQHKYCNLGFVLLGEVVARLSGSTYSDYMREALLGTIRTTSMVMFVIVDAYFLNYALGATGLGRQLTAFLEGMGLGPYGMLLVIILMYIVLGFFIETLALMIATIPIVVPIIVEMGFDKVWFGILLIVLIEMALITPPVGLNLYVVQGARKEGRLGDVMVGAIPFVFVMLVMIALLVAFPAIALVFAPA